MAEASRVRLAMELTALHDRRLADLIGRLRRGYYDEFSDDSPLDTPDIQLVDDLRKFKLESFARRVIDGEFDAGPEVSRAWAERQMHSHEHSGFDDNCTRCILDSPAFQRKGAVE